jgi:hypothetical protein
MQMATSTDHQNYTQLVGKLIDEASKQKRQIIDGLVYIALQDLLVIKCGEFWLPVSVHKIPEFRGISREEMSHVRLSPGGGSIILDSADVYIEAPMLVAEIIDQIIHEDKGGFVVDLIKVEFKREKRSHK